MKINENLALAEALTVAATKILNPETFVCAVLSGRRRNLQTPFERIDLRPVEIKGELFIQIVEFDGRKDFTRNCHLDRAELEKMLASGFANILVVDTEGSFSLKISKKGHPLLSKNSIPGVRNLNHDKVKGRLLQPSDPFLIEVGISDVGGKVKPSRMDKYKQVEEFLRLLAPTLKNAIEVGHIATPTKAKPISIVDLGCGHAYLTFAAHQYLCNEGIPVRVTGVDMRTESRDRNSAIAHTLGISDSMVFHAQEIADTTPQACDVVIALHACDTATDDAIAWAVNNEAKLILIAPCCHHDLQRQMKTIPEPWSVVTRSGLMKERLGDLLTDSLRAQLMRISGYRVEIIEFIGDEHTPRNLMIRAVRTQTKPDQEVIDQYRKMRALWGVTPALEKKLARGEIS